MNFGVGAAEQSSFRVLHINFRQQCAGGPINRFGSAYELPREPLAGKLSQHNVRGGFPRFDTSRVFFWHIHVDAQRARLNHVKEVGPRSGIAAGIDRSPISVLRAMMTPSNGAYTFSKETSAS